MFTPPSPAPARLQPAGLSYLDPSRIRIGSVGVFAIDRLLAIPGEPRTGYVGTLADSDDQGTVICCTREVAEAIIDGNERVRAAARSAWAAEDTTGDALVTKVDEAFPLLRFDGGELAWDLSARWGKPTIKPIAPTHDGRYLIHCRHWAWRPVEPASCHHIAGIIPPRGSHQEYIRLPHTGLQAPHDRWRVTSIRTRKVPAGAVHTARLRIGRRDIGIIQDTGSGPELLPAVGWARDTVDTFVSACRWRGEPATEQKVWHLLKLEYMLRKAVTAAERDHMTATRLCDAGGNILATHWQADSFNLQAASSREALTSLTRAEAPEHPGLREFVWEQWTGQQWKHIHTITWPQDQPVAYQ